MMGRSTNVRNMSVIAQLVGIKQATGVSFQYQKHLSLGRGGIILLDNKNDYTQLKKMYYDGRLPNIPWREQDVATMGYHYYMTPETAARGLVLMAGMGENSDVTQEYQDLSKFDVYK